MAESEVPVYTSSEHFQGVDARNAEQTRAEMVSPKSVTCVCRYCFTDVMTGTMILMRQSLVAVTTDMCYWGYSACSVC